MMDVEVVTHANAVAKDAGRHALVLLSAERESQTEEFQRDQLWRFLVKRGAAL